jgi:hypothetical protein
MLLAIRRRGADCARCAAGAAVLSLLAAAAIGAPDDPAADPEQAEAPETAGNGAAESPVVEFFRQTEVYGLVDAYYLWSVNETTPQLRNFDVNHNTFSLNYGEIAFAKAVSDASRAGYRVDFGAGDTADMVNSFEPGGTDYLKYVQQAYVSYLAPVGTGLTIDFGKFVTPAGAEVIENKDNFNYSRGLLFSLAIPYYHTGARIGYTVNDAVSVTGFILNGWNAVIDNNDAKTVGLSVATKPTEKLGVTANYLVGQEFAPDEDGGTRNLIDIVASYAASERLALLANVDYGRDTFEAVDVDWYGVALGAKYQVSDAFALAPRYEIFRDDDGFATGLAQTLQEVTLTAEYQASGGLITRFEFRTDFSDEDFFEKGGSLRSSQPTFGVAFIYAFGTK